MSENWQIYVPPGLAVPSYEALPSEILRLRWRFDFVDKPTRKGVWNAGSNRPEDAAWSINKTGLVRACIEAEHRRTQEEYLLVECLAQDYAFFQWEAYSRAPGLGVQGGNHTLRATIAGLSLFTRSERITVFVNGRTERRSLNADEQKFQFKEHSI